MKKPFISEKFTIEDIHAIREYNAKRRSELPLKERLADIRRKANACERDIDKYRKTKEAI